MKTQHQILVLASLDELGQSLQWIVNSEKRIVNL
jgi:hypothetical protein